MISVKRNVERKVYCVLTKNDLDHVAQLSRLELTGEEKETFTQQLNGILERFQLLERLDTTEVPPTTHILSMQNVYREDQVGVKMPQEKALANSPASDDNYFKVPRIL